MQTYSERLQAAYKAYMDAAHKHIAGEDISYTEVEMLRSDYEKLWWQTEENPKVAS